MRLIRFQSGFTLIEIAIVLLIVAILLGYTVALFPIQQELKQYRIAKVEMEQILDAVTGFAQVNGRLPCPAWPNSGGIEETAVGGCGIYTGKTVDDGKPWIGFIPVNTLGLSGKVNQDSLLLDPWGNPYRYYVTDSDFFEDRDSDNILDDDSDGDPDGDGDSDFVINGEMRSIGLSDSAIDEENNGDNEIDSDGFLDLDSNLIICDGASTASDRCTGSNEVVGNVTTLSPAAGDYSSFTYTGYAGVPVVLLSMGKNWTGTTVGNELENSGASETNTHLGIPNGPSGNEYLLDTDTVFARPAGQSDNYDDIVKWISSNTLFSKMIEADQLP